MQKRYEEFRHEMRQLVSEMEMNEHDEVATTLSRLLYQRRRSVGGSSRKLWRCVFVGSVTAVGCDGRNVFLLRTCVASTECMNRRVWPDTWMTYLARLLRMSGEDLGLFSHACITRGIRPVYQGSFGSYRELCFQMC